MKTLSAICLIAFLGLNLLLMGCTKEGLKQTETEGPKGSESDPYVIGPEDVLQVEVWREKSLSGNVPVRSDGKISMPFINEIQAAGLTPLQLQESLTEKLKDFIDSPHVFVVVAEANSSKVYVSGQVRNPGVFKLRAQTTLLQLIPMAGGFTDWANQKKIQVIRKEDGRENRFRANYKKMVEGKEPVLILKPGDTVIVP